ncbi:MAG: hypothetical protein IT582_10270 [Opitutaceae bacterium]|nr:hypothetical protein [Opitutaceae bacterium]
MDMPAQVSSIRPTVAARPLIDRYDPREQLAPRRLTLAMWDQAYLLRHGPGGSFADWGRVLDETVERGYNTVRLDPMPQWLDLGQPDRELHWPDPQSPYQPWCWNTAVTAPAGRWLIEFMEQLLARPALHYTLSAWWFGLDPAHAMKGPAPLRVPATHTEGAEMWAAMLATWQRRFGFDRLVYVDLANEVPYFFPGFLDRLKKSTGLDWGTAGAFTTEQAAAIAAEINPALALLRREFPELRFTASIHGDLRWLDVPLELDCLDVHFYADADARWAQRTKFHEHMASFFQRADWHADYSDRCRKTAAAVAPMLRQRQRAKLRRFVDWSAERGMPLTTSESWAAWYAFDSPDLDWGWLLEWAAWSVEDAIDAGMWGWTPHNYLQPHFANWRDVAWHRRLTDRFLQS